jgi:SNF2 family DNA or RNA helicase
MLLGDEMGLGKTIQALAVAMYAIRFEENLALAACWCSFVFPVVRGFAQRHK